jgi:hypothetical protein
MQGEWPHDKQLQLAARWISEAAGSLRSPAASFDDAPQLNCSVRRTPLTVGEPKGGGTERFQ